MEYPTSQIGTLQFAKAIVDASDGKQVNNLVHELVQVMQKRSDRGEILATQFLAIATTAAIMCDNATLPERSLEGAEFMAAAIHMLTVARIKANFSQRTNEQG